jgi:hypothetical protein
VGPVIEVGVPLAAQEVPHPLARERIVPTTHEGLSTEREHLSLAGPSKGRSDNVLIMPSPMNILMTVMICHKLSCSA